MLARCFTTFVTTSIAGAAILAPALVARESDQDWKVHKVEFGKVMDGAVPADMANSVRGLGRADRPEAVDMLFQILDWTNPKIQKLLAERDKIEKQVYQLYEVAARQGNALSQGDSDRLDKLINVDLKTVNEQIISENFLRSAAIEALASMRDEEAVGRMIEKGLEHKSWRVRSGVAQAMSEIKSDAATDPLIALIKDKDPKVQMVAMDTLATMGKKEAVDAILGRIAEKDWQVRVTAARALGALGDTRAIKSLIDQMQKEEGRTLEDFDAALQDLTGHTTHANPQAWVSWWNANKDKLEEVVAKKEESAEGDENVGKTVTFYGISTRSKRIMFIIDFSGSMQEPAQGAPPTAAATGGANGGESPAGKLPANPTKLDVAKWELKNAVFGLPDDAKYNIVYFNHRVDLLQQNQMLDASEPRKKGTYAWIDKLVADGGTNIYDALVKGFELAGHGQVENNYKVGVDTIFFLTDGVPTHGSVQDPNKILEDIKQRNSVRKIKIHVVAVGLDTGQLPGAPAGAGAVGVEFLEKLAEDNDGQFVQR